MDCSGAKPAPMVETKRNKAAIQTGVELRVFLRRGLADEIAHQNPEIESGPRA